MTEAQLREMLLRAYRAHATAEAQRAFFDAEVHRCEGEIRLLEDQIKIITTPPS